MQLRGEIGNFQSSLGISVWVRLAIWFNGSAVESGLWR